MGKRNIIVLGASAGGFEAIQKLISGLPADFDAAILIVWHMSPEVKGILPQMINHLKSIPASHAMDNEPLTPGRIYVAPPDHHLLVEMDRVRISRGPRENRFRPAVDPLFRSAAYTYGERVIGIILSGALDDGTAGLWTVKERGGIAIVQDPGEAAVSSMPQNALQAVRVDYTVRVADMAPLLCKLITEEVPEHNGYTVDTKTQIEVNVAMGNSDANASILSQGELSSYTCPECHGVLTALQEGGRVRFRCHTGHAFSTDSLLAAIGDNIEENLWNAIRSIQESVILLNHMGDHFAEQNNPKLAAMYFRKAKDAQHRIEMVKKAVFQHEHVTMKSIEDDTVQKELSASAS
jgi:two-component system chemotaxis response regulator CheB